MGYHRCDTTVAPYASRFFPGREQFQFFCRCGEVMSGYATRAAAEMAALNHVGVDVEDDQVEDVDRVARLRAEQAATIDSVPDFVL